MTPTCPMVRVACRATSPDPRKRNAVCGSILGDIPAGYAFVGTAARHSHAPDNRLWIPLLEKGLPGDQRLRTGGTRMSESTALVVVDPAFDKTVPTEYVGKLEPAWHCRAWNSGRRHYCKQRAGSGTDHVGSGRL
jgi:hypothetical protein